MLYQQRRIAYDSIRRQSALEAIDELFKTQQFYWFLGHLFTIIFFTCSVLTGVVDHRISLRYYQYSLVSIIISYLLMIAQIYPKSGIMFMKLKHTSIKDYNIQYFLLALVLYWSSFKIGQIRSGLYSYVIYSGLHVIIYCQKHIAPIFITKIKDKERFDSIIGRIISAINLPILFIAAIGEIVTLFLAIFQFLTSLVFLLINWDWKFVGINLFVVVVFVVFVKLRFDDNHCTNTVINLIDTRIDDIVNQINDPQLLYIYHVIRDAGIKYFSLIQLDQYSPDGAVK